MNQYILAHSADQHTDATSNFEHQATEPLIGVPLFFLALILLFYAMKHLSVKPPHMIMVFMAVFFLCGVLTFALVPAISVISLSAGILLALVFALTSI